MKFPQQGAYQVRRERTVRVAGWEEVVVLAGRFRALRVESEGTFQRLDVSLSCRAREVMCFRGRIQWRGFELVEYSVQ